MEVMNLSASDDPDPRKLADLLHRDQTLAGHVLRMANSPAYKPRMPIVSLQQAVSRLGMTQLCEIAYTVSVQGCVFKVKGYENEVSALWQHTVGAGVYAKEIARTQGYDVEKAFLWGLLHDVGKPVILLALTELQRELDRRLEPSNMIAAMDEHHTQVGGQLAVCWALPVMVTESIIYHHDYRAAPTCAEAVMVTCLADYLSHHLADPDDFSEESVRQHPVVSHLPCSPDNLTALLDKREEVLQMIESMSA
jgi:putative nucleotidyltransferase with HDIG domain